MGAAAGEVIARQLYPDVAKDKLTEEEKQTISALASISAGIAGGLRGDSALSAASGAQAGKNAVENNALSEKDQGLRPVNIIDINPMLKVGVLDEDGEKSLAGGGIAKGGKSAVSSLEGAKLKDYYRQSEKYGHAGVKELENGNYRFYGDTTPS
jgi:filamentous hemagglutinin